MKIVRYNGGEDIDYEISIHLFLSYADLENQKMTDPPEDVFEIVTTRTNPMEMCNQDEKFFGYTKLNFLILEKILAFKDEKIKILCF